MSSGGGRAEAQSAGSPPAAGQLQQALDAFQYRRHPQQAVRSKELLYVWSCTPHHTQGEAALGGSQLVQSAAAQSDVPAVRAGGAGQQNV